VTTLNVDGRFLMSALEVAPNYLVCGCSSSSLFVFNIPDFEKLRTLSTKSTVNTIKLFDDDHVVLG
jgi:hypothetical protein